MSSVSVLIVDDHESFRRVARSVVDATDGFTVAATAASGEESIEAVERLRPDLVLTDVNLPGIDGVEATRRLRTLSPSPVVVLLSSYDEGEIDGSVAHCWAGGLCGQVGVRSAASGGGGYVVKSAFGTDRLAALWASGPR